VFRKQQISNNCSNGLLKYLDIEIPNEFFHIDDIEKSFIEKYNIVDEEKKIKVKRNKELLNKVKNVLKDDYVCQNTN